VNLTALEQQIRERIGLDVASIGASALDRAVQRRILALGLTEGDYLRFVERDATEWSSLVGELVVPESWFFRGGVDFFQYLARWVRNRLNESKGTVIRVLSVPCSTGEEPYSLALALDQEGIPASRWQIDGVDLAREHLLRAVEGRYSSFSFREALDPRPKSFHLADDGRWELHPQYRERVRFRTGNLVDPGFLVAEPPYNLILCRNLFIYLTSDGRTRALANIERLLAPDGRLCLTASEADRLAGGPFVSDGPVSLALFQRSRGEKTLAPRSGVLGLPRKPSGSQPRAASRSGVTRSYTHVSLPHAAPVCDSIGETRRLADAGNLDAARTLCLKTIASETPTANHFSLLGIIHLATGATDDATEAFRKALYLEPGHAEALTHMIVLCEQRGDGDQAAGLRRRLSRLKLGAVS